MYTYDLSALMRALLETSGRASFSLARLLVASLIRVLPSSPLIVLACVLGWWFAGR